MAKDHRRPNAQMAQGSLLDDPDFLHEIVERVLQELLEAEVIEHIGAAPHERTDARKGHRNRYKPRTLRTRVGTLNLLVPQDREGTFSTRLFCRYQRNERALVLALMEMYLEGVSTRKVKDVTEELCGTSFSKSLGSSSAGRLDSELEAWRSRRLESDRPNRGAPQILYSGEEMTVGRKEIPHRAHGEVVIGPAACQFVSLPPPNGPATNGCDLKVNVLLPYGVPGEGAQPHGDVSSHLPQGVVGYPELLGTEGSHRGGLGGRLLAALPGVLHEECSFTGPQGSPADGGGDYPHRLRPAGRTKRSGARAAGLRGGVRSRLPKLSELMEEAGEDVLSYALSPQSTGRRSGLTTRRRG